MTPAQKVNGIVLTTILILISGLLAVTAAVLIGQILYGE